MGNKYFWVVKFVLVILLFSGCWPSNDEPENSLEKKEQEVDPEFFSLQFSGVGLIQPTPVTIEATFSESGEWGGHFEEVIISANSEEEFTIHYVQYAKQCGPLCTLASMKAIGKTY
jgi:hypothetical protein